MNRSQPEPDPAPMDVFLAFRAANLTFDLIGQTLRDAVALGRTDLRVLELLSVHGSLHPGRLQAELRLGSATISELIDRLEAARCVRRTPDAQDGRRTRVVITTTGRRRWSAAHAIISSCVEDAVAALSAEERRVVWRFLVSAQAACELALQRADGAPPRVPPEG